MRMMSNFLLLLVAVLPFGNPYSFVRISPTSTLFRRNLNLLQESKSSEITGLDDSSNRRVGKMGKASAELLLSVSNKGNEIFDFSETSNILTNDLFTQWERQVDDVIAEMIQFTRKDAVMAAYKSILTKASAKALDSLQQATFEVLSNSLVDALIKIHPEDAPITIVIDSLTNFHLTFIDDFAKTINERPTSTSADASVEFLSYQFAGLLLKIYGRVVASMGMGYDTTEGVQEMRLNHWVDPVFKKMQTLCPGFNTLSVEERLEEMYASAFDEMLSKIKLELSTKYMLPDTTISAKESNTTHPSWEYANFISKLIRNTFSNIELSTLDNKVLRMYQSELSTRMRRVGHQIEKIASDNRIAAADKDIVAVEDMLNIGHLVVAGVYTIWHVRYNIVGTKNEDDVVVKDYLLPITMYDFDKTMECVPKHMRTEILSDIQLQVDKYPHLPSYLKAAMVLSHAVRITAAEDYRALITYNANSDDWPDSRDDVFVAVLSAYLSSILTSTSQTTSTTTTTDGVDNANNEYSVVEIDNMIAMAALDESIGAREPRAAVSKAYTLALQNAVQSLFTISTDGDDLPAAINELKKRIQRTELLLSTCLRLSEGSGVKCSQAAFKSVVESIINVPNSASSGQSSFKRLEKLYPVAAQALSVDQKVAQAFVIPLGLRRFDKSVGGMLMNADLSYSMPEMGDAFQSQLHEMAEDISLEKTIADKRVVKIAAAVLQSFLESILEETRRANFKNVDTVLAKSFYLCQHPLVLKLETESVNTDLKVSVVASAVEATSLRLGSSLFVELLRSVETAKQRQTASQSEGSSNTGWGGGGSSLGGALATDPRFPQFLGALQAALLKQYTASAMKASFGR